MSDALRKAMTEEEIVERIATDDLWKSLWFSFNKLVVRFYVTMIVFPIILIDNTYDFIYPIFGSIIYDIFYGKRRIHIIHNKRSFIYAYIFLSIKDTKLVYYIVFLILIYLISLYLMVVNYYIFILFTLLFTCIIIFEYVMIHVDSVFVWFERRVEKQIPHNQIRSNLYSTENNNLTAIRLNIDKIGGDTRGSFISHTKTFSTIWLALYYSVYLVMSSLYISSASIYEQPYYFIKYTFLFLTSITVFSTMVFALSIRVRAREVAEKYLSIMKECKA